MLAALLAGGLVLVSGGAGAQGQSQPPGSSCDTLELTQTYDGWGPAGFYRRPVTVHYQASGCSITRGSTLNLLRQGTATVYPGTSASGDPIDQRPFLVQGLWVRPASAAGWPLAWWGCHVTLADYSWKISGVYTFRVKARGGEWKLRVANFGALPNVVRWQHDGCG